MDGLTHHLGFFAQDDFRVTSKLTLSYGVRYELHPMFFDRALTTSQFDRTAPGPGGRVIISNEAARKVTSPAFAASIGNTPIVLAKDVGLPETLRFNDTNNFMPRFGFAYRPFGNNKTVLRGGYGIYTATVLGSVFYTITGIHVSDARTFPNQLVNGVPALAFPRPFGTGLGALGTPDFRRATQWDGANPYTQQWNLTAERELPFQTGLRLTYSGSRSIKLFSSPDLNQVPVNNIGFANARVNRPFPVWNIIYTRDPNTGAWFNSFSAELHKRYAKGLFFQTSYVWAKNLSNATGSDGSGFASENGSVPTDRFNQRLDYGNVPASRRQRWLTTFTYDLPLASWTGASRAAKLVAGGWQLSGILLVQSGPFLTQRDGSEWNRPCHPRQQSPRLERNQLRQSQRQRPNRAGLVGPQRLHDSRTRRRRAAPGQQRHRGPLRQRCAGKPDRARHHGALPEASKALRHHRARLCATRRFGGEPVQHAQLRLPQPQRQRGAIRSCHIDPGRRERRFEKPPDRPPNRLLTPIAADPTWAGRNFDKAFWVMNVFCNLHGPVMGVAV